MASIPATTATSPRDSRRPGAPGGYVQGSWRGIEFLTVDHRLSGGRRGELHEFPQRDTPWFEDLGERALERSLTFVLLGGDYMAVRDRMLVALRKKGPGVLVHPFLGTMDVVVRDWELSESTGEGGMASFSVQFSDPGQKAAGEVNTDTGDTARATAAVQSDAAIDRFARKFSVKGLPGYAVDGALANISMLTGSALDAGRLLGGAGKVLRTFESGLDLLDGALDLIETPFRLANSVRTMVRAVAGLGASPLARLRALRRMFDGPSNYRPVIGMTPVRVAERANAAVFAQLVTNVVAAEAVAVCTEVRFSSREEAVSLRDSFAAQLDVVAHAYADAGDDEPAAALDALRLAMVRDVTSRGSSLERLARFTPDITSPALIIAYRLYGLADLSDRADELVARNRLPHPGFVSGGVALSVLSGVEARRG